MSTTDKFESKDFEEVEYLDGWEDDNYRGARGVYGNDLLIHRATGIVFSRRFESEFKGFIDRVTSE